MAYFQRMLACFFAVNNIPLSIIEDWTFQQLFLLWKPNLKMPGRCGIRNLMVREFKDEKERMKQFFNSRSHLKVIRVKFHNVLQFNDDLLQVSIKFDIWTANGTGKSFLAVTAHFVVDGESFILFCLTSGLTNKFF